jgi:hypothetical protein
LLQIGDAFKQKFRSERACFFEAKARGAELSLIKNVNRDNRLRLLNGAKKGFIVSHAQIVSKPN